MKKVLLLLLCAVTLASNAQNNSQAVCKIYGKVQGVYYDALIKMCNTASSDEACKDLLTEFSNSLDAATTSRRDYVSANTEGCEFVVKIAEDGVEFVITALYATKAKMKQLLRYLNQSQRIIINSENLE